MDDNIHERTERLLELAEVVVGCYSLIIKMLSGLPLPIQLPEPQPWSAEIIIPAVDRARALIQDLPLDTIVKGLLDRMLINWIASHEMGALAMLVGPLPWRLDAMEANLVSFEAAREVLAKQFGFPDLPSEE